jgi:hypothetical protein
MAESNLTFSKIVANPNAYSWSQVYSAGKLFAALSLEAKEEREEKDYLNVLGKEILDTLEQEFFTLETKDLESIKQAVTATSSKIPHEINCSFVITVIIENILYIYILGNGKVSLRRDGKLGALLEANDQKPDSLKVSSGFLQQNDTVILQTKQFSDVISVDTLSEFLDNLTPAEASENLAPLVHEKEDGGAASIIINYKQARKEEPEEFAEKTLEESQNPEIEEKLQQESKRETPFYQSSLEKTRKTSFSLSFLPIFSSLINKIKLPRNFEISHSRKIILTIIIVIIVVFMGSIIFALNKQKDTKTQSEFNNIYPQALKKYQEGQGLIDLNKNLANDSFNQAKQILEGGKDKLPKTSNEEKQVLDLLSKVNNALGTGATTTQTISKTNTVDLSKSPLLLLETTENGLYYSEDGKNLYSLTQDSVFSFDKTGGNKKEIVKNQSDWQAAGGLSNYFGNIYVLDKKQNQILKYVSLDSGLAKTNYFGADTTPDFSKAVSMAIDSSVYVLSSDGTINKFTKGKADTFSINGLSKPLSNPKAIVTNADDTNVYVLDNGNSRIVVFDKSGNYKTEYGASIIKSAKDFEVLESDKIVYVLSGGKLFQIDLK